MLLLDEITVDLDLLSRSEFLGWLKGETEKRACTVVYATHVLDGLAGWPTHLVHMHMGRVKEVGAVERFEVGEGGRSRTGNSALGELVLGWLRKDLEKRGPRGGSGRGGEGKTYESLEGKGGYGNEKRV